MVDRTATSTLFGFDFQTNAAIVLMLENIKDMTDIRMEGYEDVEIGIIVEKDGSILYPDVISSANREWDAEALRLVNKMPQWKPGTIDGVKVRQRAFVRFNFGKLERSCILFEDYYYD